jgi:hypothetical protein
MRVMISIDKKDNDMLEKLDKEERRTKSNEIVYLLDCYLKNKKD